MDYFLVLTPWPILYVFHESYSNRVSHAIVAAARIIIILYDTHT